MSKKILIIILSSFTLVSIVGNFYQKNTNSELNDRNYRLSNTEINLNNEVSDLEYKVSRIQQDLETCYSEKQIVDAKLQKIEKTKNVGLKYKTLYTLNLHEHFKEDSGIILRVPKGSTINVVNSFFGGWYEVYYNGTKGWIIASVDGFPVDFDVLGFKKDEYGMSYIKPNGEKIGIDEKIKTLKRIF